MNFNFHFQINLQNEDLKILVVTKCFYKIYIALLDYPLCSYNYYTNVKNLLNYENSIISIMLHYHIFY